MRYKLFAMRYGRQPKIAVADTLTFSKSNTFDLVEFEYFFWLAQAESATVLIDCGFSISEGQRRGRTSLAQPVDLLKELGIDPNEITDILLTHLHYDHAGNIGHFPNAKIHVHLEEWRWIKEFSKLNTEQAKYYDKKVVAEISDLADRNLVHFIKSDDCYLYGLKLTRVGGHCPGQLIVEVPTLQGNVLLTSDASHLSDNYEKRDPFPIYEDLDLALSGLDCIAQIKASGARIVAGHDPEVLERYTPCGSSGNIVALHEGVENV